MQKGTTSSHLCDCLFCSLDSEYQEYTLNHSHQFFLLLLLLVTQTESLKTQRTLSTDSFLWQDTTILYFCYLDNKQLFYCVFSFQIALITCLSLEPQQMFSIHVFVYKSTKSSLLFIIPLVWSIWCVRGWNKRRQIYDLVLRIPPLISKWKFTRNGTLEASFLNYGATLFSFKSPDRNGNKEVMTICAESYH